MDTPTSKEIGGNRSLDILLMAYHQYFQVLSADSLKIFSQWVPSESMEFVLVSGLKTCTITLIIRS